ncbi:MAG: hypothetical protein WC489_01100 [Patescibacteria group bacterium]
MKIKYIFLLFCCIFLFPFQKTVFSAESFHIDFFYSTTCPHCAKAKVFLEDLTHDYPQVTLNQYESSKNTSRLIELYEKYQVPLQLQGLVPVIFIDQTYFVGFDDQTARQVGKSVVNAAEDKVSVNKSDYVVDDTIIAPFIGKIDPSSLALPVIAVMLGVMDGFNVCSLGALLIILTLVLALKSRFKTLVFGGAFILMTALIYGLLIFFWYQLFNLITPYLRQLELLIGILTIGGGLYFFKEFLKFRKQGPTCSIGTAQKIEGSFSRKFQSLLDNKARTLTVLLSIVIFASVITVVEFPCSAAVPVAFACILTKAELPGWLYFFYIILYVLFYMFDEVLVFLIAFFTTRLWLASPKFITWITLLESLIMFSLGIYYFFGIW